MRRFNLCAMCNKKKVITQNFVVFFPFCILECYSNDEAMFLVVFSGPLNSISRGHEMIFYVFFLVWWCCWSGNGNQQNIYIDCFNRTILVPTLG